MKKLTGRQMNELKLVMKPCLVPVDTDVISIDDNMVDIMKNCATTAKRIVEEDFQIRFIYVEDETDE